MLDWVSISRASLSFEPPNKLRAISRAANPRREADALQSMRSNLNEAESVTIVCAHLARVPRSGDNCQKLVSEERISKIWRGQPLRPVGLVEKILPRDEIWQFSQARPSRF